MKQHTLPKALCVSAALMLLGCNGNDSGSATTDTADTITPPPAAIILKDKFSTEFTMGTAISRAQILNPNSADLEVVKQHFNTFTPENSMKWERIHPQLEEFDFVAADALVDFALQHNQQLVGHTLVWHSQTPDWVFEDDEGNPLSREQLLERMQTHINTVAGRYADQIFAWDVVNEALNEDGSLRDSKWRQIIGDDFIEQAFKMAHIAAPKVKLYYNDYNLFKPEKRAGAIALIKAMQQKGIQIDGIGMQAHYALDYPEFSQVEDSIIAYGETGIDVMITELDISVLPFPEELDEGADVSLDVALQEKYNPYAEGLPAEVHEQLGKRYQDLFAIFKRHSDKIGRVTFWGVSDAHSWRNGWPMKGRTDYPLLIDRNLELKDFVERL